MTKRELKRFFIITEVVAWLLIAGGIALGLFMYFSTFMPCNPWRKIFYVVAFAIFFLGIHIGDVSERGRKMLKNKRRV